MSTVAQAKVMTTVEKLSASWHKARSEDDEFSAGRCAGYAYAIALLLDTTTSAVNQALHEEKL